MATVKQRFKKTRTSFKINTFLFIFFLLLVAAGGFLLSDSSVTNYTIFDNKVDCEFDINSCGELMNLTQEFIDESNYWRNEDIRCEKQLWACTLQLKQVIAKQN